MSELGDSELVRPWAWTEECKVLHVAAAIRVLGWCRVHAANRHSKASIRVDLGWPDDLHRLMSRLDVAACAGRSPAKPRDW